MATFACVDCGSVSVILPAELIDSAQVRCSGCGRAYGCWAEFKQDVEQIISAEPSQAGEADEELPVEERSGKARAGTLRRGW